MTGTNRPRAYPQQAYVCIHCATLSTQPHAVGGVVGSIWFQPACSCFGCVVKLIDSVVGGYGGGGTPGPIPNPEAKPSSADGTALARVWESRSPPTFKPKRAPANAGALFCFLAASLNIFAGLYRRPPSVPVAGVLGEAGCPHQVLAVHRCADCLVAPAGSDSHPRSQLLPRSAARAIRTPTRGDRHRVRNPPDRHRHPDHQRQPAPAADGATGSTSGSRATSAGSTGRPRTGSTATRSTCR